MARRDQILAMVGKLAEEPAQMPGEDGPVDIIVRELTGTQSTAFEAAVNRDAPNLLGFLLQMVIVDPDTGKLLFETADRDALQELGFRALKPIVEIAQRQSGLTESDLNKVKQDLLKSQATV